MKPMTATAALVLAFAGAACSQETTQPASEAAAPEVTSAAATEDDLGEFNLMIPGDDAADNDEFGGFNLSIPGEEADDILLPGSSVTESTFGDIETIPAQAPSLEPPVEDDLIRIDPED